MNFDNITAGNIGAISYLGREIVQPVELIGLWTLADGVYTDLSRYNGYSQIPNTTAPTTEYGFPVLKCPASTTLSFTLGKPLDLQQDWSFEYMRWEPTGRPSSFVNLGVFKFINDSYDNGWSYLYANNTAVGSRFEGWRFPGASIHNAVTYDSATHTIRCYANGSLIYTCVYDTTGLDAATLVSLVNYGVGYAGSDTNYGRSNLRIIQKRLGDTTYPTPTGLYTGFETL